MLLVMEQEDQRALEPGLVYFMRIYCLYKVSRMLPWLKDAFHPPAELVESEHDPAGQLLVVLPKG